MATCGGLRRYLRRPDASVLVLVRWVFGFATFRVVVGFLLCDVCEACVLVWAYASYTDVATLGWLLHVRSGYITLSVLRLLFSCCGIWAVVRRKVKMARVYFFFFFANGVFVIWSVVPWLALSCNCNNHYQCAALAAFSKSPIINPWPPVNERGAHLLAHPIPFKKPPGDPEKLSPFKNKGEFQWAQSKTSSLSESGHTAGHTASDSRDSCGSTGSPEVWRPQSCASEGGCSSDVHVASWPRGGRASAALQAILQTGEVLRRQRGQQQQQHGHSGGAAEEESRKLGIGLKRFLAERVIRRWWEGRKLRVGMDYYDPGVPGLGYTGTSKTCRDVDGVKHGDVLLLWTKVSHMRAKRMAVFDTALEKLVNDEAWKCAGSGTCKMVSVHAAFSPMPSEETPLQTQLCAHDGWPRWSRERREGFDVGMYLLLTDMINQEEKNAHAHERKTMYKMRLAATTPAKGLSRIQNLLEKECVCDLSDGDNCRVYRDAEGQARHWCYVAERSVDKCLHDGIKLFFDGRARKAWSEHLCREQADCECSGLGMPPRNDKVREDKQAELWPNKLNYGARCERWAEDDAMRWCYVGFDSTCADRTSRAKNLYAGMDLPELAELPEQYRSALPCNGPDQEELVMKAVESCSIVDGFIDFLCIADLCLRIPMVFVLWRFISNRLNDKVESEDQFAIVWSSEDEGEGEGEDAAGKDEGEDWGRAEAGVETEPR